MPRAQDRRRSVSDHASMLARAQVKQPRCNHLYIDKVFPQESEKFLVGLE